MDILDELAKPEIPFQTLLDKRNYSLCMRHPQFYFSDGNVTFLVRLTSFIFNIAHSHLYH